MRHIQQFTWTQMFDEDECDQLVALAKSREAVAGGVLSDKPSWRDKLSRNCKVTWLPADPETAWAFLRIRNRVTQINDRWLGFNLDGEMEPLQYLDYGMGNFYNWHVDNGGDVVATRKLTCVIQLSDPSDYKGGRLELDSQTHLPNGAYVNHAPKYRGTAIIFPSHIRHVARPVWWGNRKAVVAWFHGKETLK